MDDLFLRAIRVMAELDKLAQEGQFTALRGRVDDLNTAMRQNLPVKADGTPYTDAEVDEALARANAPLDEIDQRHGGGN